MIVTVVVVVVVVLAGGKTPFLLAIHEKRTQGTCGRSRNALSACPKAVELYAVLPGRLLSEVALPCKTRASPLAVRRRSADRRRGSNRRLGCRAL